MNKNNKNNNVKVKSKAIKNPSETTLGKVAVWVLIGIMVLIPVVSLIYLIATSF